MNAVLKLGSVDLIKRTKTKNKSEEPI